MNGSAYVWKKQEDEVEEMDVEAKKQGLPKALGMEWTKSQEGPLETNMSLMPRPRRCRSESSNETKDGKSIPADPAQLPRIALNLKCLIQDVLTKMSEAVLHTSTVKNWSRYAEDNAKIDQILDTTC